MSEGIQRTTKMSVVQNTLSWICLEVWKLKIAVLSLGYYSSTKIRRRKLLPKFQSVKQLAGYYPNIYKKYSASVSSVSMLLTNNVTGRVIVQEHIFKQRYKNHFLIFPSHSWGQCLPLNLSPLLLKSVDLCQGWIWPHIVFKFRLESKYTSKNN